MAARFPFAKDSMRLALVLAAVGGLATAVVVALLVFPGSSEPSGPPLPPVAGTMTIDQERPVAGELVAATGRLGVEGAEQPVVLQSDGAGDWATIGEAETADDGSFAVEGPVDAPGALRVVAAKTVIDDRPRPESVIGTAEVRLARQTAESRLLPGIAQQGPDVAASDDADWVVAARFAPARPGRPVVMEQEVDGSWEPIGKAEQNENGTVRLTGVVRPGAPVRARAEEHRGAPAQMTEAMDSALWEETLLTTEFDGDEIPAPWSVRAPGVTGGSRLCSTSEPEVANVRDGALVLTSERIEGSKKDCETEYGTYHRYRNGHVGTQDEFQFTHGIAAARIKFPETIGQHGAFWIQSPVKARGAEIDVVEFFGKRKEMEKAMSHVIHVNLEEGYDTYGGRIPETLDALADEDDTWWDNYHVFSVEWTPDEYIFRIDGMQTLALDRGTTSNRQFPILSNLSSDWELKGNDGTPADMFVDWVRIWPLPDED